MSVPVTFDCNQIVFNFMLFTGNKPDFLPPFKFVFMSSDCKLQENISAKRRSYSKPGAPAALKEQQHREKRKVRTLVDGIGIPEIVSFETLFYSSPKTTQVSQCLLLAYSPNTCI